MISFSSEQKFIVTGASSGIGEGVALLLNELGASVIAIGRNEERLSALKQKAKYPENMFLEQKDLTEDIGGLPAYVKDKKKKYGKFQGLVNSAGVVCVIPAKNASLFEIRQTFDINYFSAIMLSQGFLDRRVNIGNGASIVSLASISVKVCDKGQIAYAGSKAALVASMKVMAKEVASQGVRINTILPSMIETPMQDKDSDYYIEMKAKYPLGFGKVSDVANFIVFLLSDKAKWITGQDYIIDCATY